MKRYIVLVEGTLVGDYIRHEGDIIETSDQIAAPLIADNKLELVMDSKADTLEQSNIPSKTMLEGEPQVGPSNTATAGEPQPQAPGEEGKVEEVTEDQEVDGPTE